LKNYFIIFNQDVWHAGMCQISIMLFPVMYKYKTTLHTGTNNVTG